MYAGKTRRLSPYAIFRKSMVMIGAPGGGVKRKFKPLYWLLDKCRFTEIFHSNIFPGSNPPGPAIKRVFFWPEKVV